MELKARGDFVSSTELDRVRMEMSDSLAKANVEITQLGQILEGKERMLVELQDKYDAVLDEMKNANESAKKKFQLQVEQMKTLEALESEEKSALSAEISQLSTELLSVKSDSQNTIRAMNNEIKGMSEEIKEAKRLRDEAMKNKSGLEQSLMLAVENAEKTMRAQSLELEQMNVQVEKAIAAVTREAEKSRQLQSDLKEMSEYLSMADIKIKKKESALANSMKKNEQLLRDIDYVKITSQKDALSKVAEMNALKEIVANLTASVDKEIKLRQDVVAGKTVVESLLQKKLDEATKAVDSIRAEARKAIDSQAAELRKLEGTTSTEKIGLTAEITKLKNDMSMLQANAQAAIDARTNEIRNLDIVIANLKATIAEETKLKEASMHGKSELEKALQTKINQLSESMAVAQKNAMMAVKEKNLELDRLDARIKELADAVKAEIALKVQATKERDDMDDPFADLPAGRRMGPSGWRIPLPTTKTWPSMSTRHRWEQVTTVEIWASPHLRRLYLLRIRSMIPLPQQSLLVRQPRSLLFRRGRETQKLHLCLHLPGLLRWRGE